MATASDPRCAWSSTCPGVQCALGCATPRSGARLRPLRLRLRGCGVALIHGVSSVGRGMTGLGRVRFAKWRKRERESIWSGRSARCSHGAAQPLLLMILCQLRVIFLLDWMRRAPLPRHRCLCGAFVTGDVSARPGAAWCSV